MRVFVLPGKVGPTLREALEASGHEARDAPPPPASGLAQAERAWFLAAIDGMLACDALLADAEDPGAGWATAWFLAKGRLAVLAYRKEARGAISPLVAGNPSPWQKLVPYGEERELREALAALLR